jgi:hypothetical protein
VVEQQNNKELDVWSLYLFALKPPLQEKSMQQDWKNSLIL